MFVDCIGRKMSLGLASQMKRVIYDCVNGKILLKRYLDLKKKNIFLIKKGVYH